MISRDGCLFGKLSLSLRRTGDKFGPRVESTGRKLESRYRNFVVVSSKSGKMTSLLMREWIDRVLAPPLADSLSSSDIKTEVGEGGLYDPQDDDVF